MSLSRISKAISLSIIASGAVLSSACNYTHVKYNPDGTQQITYTPVKGDKMMNHANACIRAVKNNVQIGGKGTLRGSISGSNGGEESIKPVSLGLSASAWTCTTINWNTPIAINDITGVTMRLRVGSSSTRDVDFSADPQGDRIFLTFKLKASVLDKDDDEDAQASFERFLIQQAGLALAAKFKDTPILGAAASAQLKKDPAQGLPVIETEWTGNESAGKAN